MVVSLNPLRVVRDGALVTAIAFLVILSVGCWATVVGCVAAVVGSGSALSITGLSVACVASFVFSVGLIVLRSFSKFFSVACGNDDVTSSIVVAEVVFLVAVVGLTLDFITFLRVVVVVVVFLISVGNTVFTFFDTSLDLFAVFAALPFARTADL